MKRIRGAVFVLAALGCLTWVEPRASAELKFGRPEISLAGRAAPPPSSSVCGLVLVALDTGPQVLFTENPSQAFLALEPGEEIRISIPLLGTASAVTATAEAVPLAGEASVSVSMGEAQPVTRRVSATLTRFSVAVPTNQSSGALILKVVAGAKPAGIQWRNLRLVSDGRELAVPIYPGSGDVDVCPPRTLPACRPVLDRVMIEWDWRMQDGIGTQRAPASYAEAIDKLLRRGDALLQDLDARGFGSPIPRVRWESLHERFRDLKGLRETDDQLWEELWRTAHEVRREIVLSNPLFKDRPLAFVKQVPSMFSHQLTQYYGSCARAGGGVFVLDQPGRSMTCRNLVAGAFPPGSFQHLDLSPAADRLRFAYCAVASTPKDREQCLDRFYHVYEMAVDGKELKQLTDGSFDDFSPRFLPDGGLVFLSTRRGGFHRCGRGPCAVYTLCLAGADGSNPRPISWHETQEWDPAVLHDGRIVYTRWDYVDRNAVHYQQLWSARPDGTGVRILYGNNTLNPVGVWEARPVPGSDLIMATAAAHHAMTAGSIILVDSAKEPDGLAPIARLTPDALFPESEAPVAMMPKGAWSAPAGLTGAVPVPPEAKRWPGHCYRSPQPLSDKHFLAAYSFDPLIGEPTWNRANLFGLYLVDAFENKELLYRDLNIASLWPVLLEPRRPAMQTAGAVDDPEKKEGTVFLQNVYVSWPLLPTVPIKRLRIVQVLPKSTPHANAPMVGAANASPGRQVLGTVPVESDGSAYFKVPAGLPIAFQALDEQGQAVQTMRSLTYLQPGEMLSCVGCHEPRTTAPHSARPSLALSRTPSAIAPGPPGSKPFSFPLLVQPVLDRHCTGCHKAPKPEGGIVLTGEAQGQFTASYNALISRVPYSDWAGRSGDFRVVNSEPLTRPGFFGARASKLMAKLRAGHSKVKLDPDEFERLVTWMDANALFYGTFDPQDQARQRRGEQIAGPRIE